MGVKIVDCTIRDGGYLLNKNPDIEFIKDVIEGLQEAGIDFIETGFLQNKSNGENLVYSDVDDAKKYLPDKRMAKFIGFCDNSRYSAEHLSDCDSSGIEWIRISFAKHECEDALKFGMNVINKGYKIQLNPMDTVTYSDDEIKHLIEEINKIKPDTLSIVDTFGAMDLDDLIKLFTEIDSFMEKSIPIGLHSHDNLGLSAALAQLIIILAEEKKRDIIIDGSLLGMGRGAGNAPTEVLASYLNKKHGKKYNISKLIEIIEKYISPLKASVHWGYDLPMFVCGVQHAHVDNIHYMKEHTTFSTRDMYNILGSMPLGHRTRYGTGYNKTDFSNLQKIYRSYIGGNI